MFFKNEEYEKELDRLSLEVERAHLRITSLKKSNLDLEKMVRKLVCDQKIENCRKKFCYTITENDIVSSYENPKYLIKHIQACLSSNTPFTLNNMAKNYWLDSLKNNEENEPVDLKYTAEATTEKEDNSTFQWR